MASQVLSGNSNVSYTNNTGQNVRVVINYMQGTISPDPDAGYLFLYISWAGVSVNTTYVKAIGRNLAYSIGTLSVGSYYQGSVGASLSANNMVVENIPSAEVSNVALPTELMLAPGQTFSATCGVYNVVVIPEAG